MLAEDISFEPYALAIARGDAAMRLAVNRTLSRLSATGEIDAIFKYWLGALGRPGGLLAAMYVLNTIPQ
jgi:ABC-type amino acid transport substrate-binding protein